MPKSRTDSQPVVTKVLEPSEDLKNTHMSQEKGIQEPEAVHLKSLQYRMRAQRLNCTSVPPFDYSSITPSLSHSVPKRKIADYSILLSEVLSAQKHHGRHGTRSWRGTKLLS